MRGSEEREEKRAVYHKESNGELFSKKETSDIYCTGHIYKTCAYCRVSTDNESQLSSFELQKEHYEKLAEVNKNWDLKHIYADEGISGTSLKKRDAFNAMIAACEAGEYELIITKSVSRFARNIVDCISLVRRLKQLNPPVGVYFETDNLFTLSEDSELKLSILATIAQEESAKKSESMNWSLEQRFKTGKLLTPPLLGYDRPRDSSGNYIKYGKLEIVESEAEIVKYIFDAFLSGEPISSISEWLTNIGCPTKLGNRTWSDASIRYILTNERYCGYVLTWKTFTADIYEHSVRKNNRNRNQYLYRENHPAIISVEKFEAVQKQMRSHILGNRGAFHTTQVVDAGMFKGYVPIDSHWENNDPIVYFNASSEVKQQTIKQRINKRDISVFDLDGYQIVSSRFLTTKTEYPYITLSSRGITFNACCFRKLVDTSYIQILLHPFKRIIAIRPCEKNDSYSVKWGSTGATKNNSKTIVSRYFCEALFQIMGWNPELTYKVCGAFYSNANKKIIIFNLENSDSFIKVENKKRQVIFDEEIGESFGTDFYEHEIQNMRNIQNVMVKDTYAKCKVIEDDTISLKSLEELAEVREKLKMRTKSNG